MNMNELDEFTQSYITTALWTSTDSDDEFLNEKYAIGDLAPETLEKMIKDCQKFQSDHKDSLSFKEPRMGGHDFWLTRNGHGAGFWDGDWPEEVEDILTKAAKEYPGCDLYVGDDGLIYLM